MHRVASSLGLPHTTTGGKKLVSARELLPKKVKRVPDMPPCSRNASTKPPATFCLYNAKFLLSQGASFFLHSVLKDSDILVTPFFLAVPVELSKLVANRAAALNDMLKRSQPSTKCFD